MNIVKIKLRKYYLLICVHFLNVNGLCVSENISDKLDCKKQKYVIKKENNLTVDFYSNHIFRTQSADITDGENGFCMFFRGDIYKLMKKVMSKFVLTKSPENGGKIK